MTTRLATLFLLATGAILGGCGAADPDLESGDEVSDEEVGTAVDALTFPAATPDVGADAPLRCSAYPYLPAANLRRELDKNGKVISEKSITAYEYAVGAYSTASGGRVILAQRNLVDTPIGGPKYMSCAKVAKPNPTDPIDGQGAPPTTNNISTITYTINTTLPKAAVKGACPNHPAKVAPSATNVQLNDPQGLERDSAGKATGRLFLVKLSDGSLEPLGLRDANNSPTTVKAGRVDKRVNWCRGKI